MKRNITGTALALLSLAVLTVAMLPWRSQLSIATPALILVVPVVLGVASGAFAAGAISVVAGFFVYDLFFIPPYQALTVGEAQNWLALGVYVIVMLVVARVVANMNDATIRARRQGRELRELLELSDLLLADKPLDGLLATIATTLADVFACEQVALLLPRDERLTVVASAGKPLSDRQLQRLIASPGQLHTLNTPQYERDGLLVLALVAAGRPVGLLALSADPAARHEREPLLLFANHIALAAERVQLREQALQKELAEEVARLAKTLVSAVSHDLRAPLTSIKASSSTLSDAEISLNPETVHRLATLIDIQADRLADLVQNLLDMSRIQAGVLQPRYSIASLPDLVTKVVHDLSSGTHDRPVVVDVSDDLPPIDADLVLIARVLTNLLENAIRHSPRSAPIAVHAEQRTLSYIELSVTDHGPGISLDRRDKIFQLFARRDDDAGAGLGLTIAKTFVEAHGQRIWVDDTPGGGAKFCFTIAIAAPLTEEPRHAASAHH